MPCSIMRVIYSHVYLFIRTTHLLIRNFFDLNSTSIAFSISIEFMMYGCISRLSDT